MAQRVYEGAIVKVEGYEFVASDVLWSEYMGKPCVRFTGKCTDDPRNDGIRRTGYNGGRYGGTEYEK